ncbi:hypothetical protein [Bdellovibrio sp. BCCA]|uniref:hypothetical protein n=1 Tax=Bdellovibrio sp. BCCA TaxID=3136281 RepID=UPI0030F13887
MKTYQQILTIAAIAFTSATSFAGYDEFNCRSSGQRLKNTYLECVSCGAQKYFADKADGREVVPSEKWLALLGTMAVQHMKLDDSGKNNIATNFDARANYQRVVISMLRDYGFCQKYISKDWSKRATEKSSDVAPNDWESAIYPGLTRNSNLDYKAMKSLGKYYGFDSSLFGWDASENMNYLLLNSPDPFKSNNPSDAADKKFADKYPTYNVGQSKSERRPSFVRRLKQALQSDYDVSGEKKSGGDRIVQSGDKDNGLTECLREIERMQEGKGDPLLNSFLQSQTENSKFCREMTASCEISSDVCGSSVSSPTPTSSGRVPLAPPPGPRQKQGQGVK